MSLVYKIQPIRVLSLSRPDSETSLFDETRYLLSMGSLGYEFPLKLIPLPCWDFLLYQHTLFFVINVDV